MKRSVAAFTAVCLVLGSSAFAAKLPDKPAKSQSSQHSPMSFTGQVVSGYFGGVGVHASGTLNNFAQGFPFNMRLGLGYAKVANGDAVGARRIFIDQNTNGSPRGWAKVWDARLDVQYPVKLFSLKNTVAYGGPRHANYTVHYEYIGGNETFDVVSKQWGIGGGVETAFPVSPRVQMIFNLGADHFFKSLLSGHDTYYRPNGDDLNAKENFTYKDADEVIDQPDLEIRLMFGVSYLF